MGVLPCTLLDRDKPLWPGVTSEGVSRIRDEEMARISIEASAALAEWVAAIEGDIETDRDAARLCARGVPACKILPGGACHLDARQVSRALDEAHFPALDILFIENVASLICPTNYDLGEDFEVVVLSVTEGNDKPFKYPAIFARADVALISKMDPLPHVTFDLDAVKRQVGALNPRARLLYMSAKTGEGIADCRALLDAHLRSKRRPANQGLDQ